jgi:hypothetical protein
MKHSTISPLNQLEMALTRAMVEEKEKELKEKAASVQRQAEDAHALYGRS